MISINDLVWSEENDNEKIANAIPINCMAYNCTYSPIIFYPTSDGGFCSRMALPVFSENSRNNCIKL